MDIISHPIVLLLLGVEWVYKHLTFGFHYKAQSRQGVGKINQDKDAGKRCIEDDFTSTAYGIIEK